MGRSIGMSRWDRAWSEKTGDCWLSVVGCRRPSVFQHPQQVALTTDDRRPFLQLEMENIHYEEVTLINQHDVPANHGVHIAYGRGRQVAYYLNRTRAHVAS